MNPFNLRFRRKKLLVGVGLAIGLLAMPLFQLANAAAGDVALDVNEAVRIDGGPNATTHYSRSAAVQPQNVVEVSNVIHNPEDPNSGKVAKNVKLRVLLPKGSVTAAHPYADVLADNLAPRAPYTTHDQVDITSANGQPFQIGANIRSFKIQRNQNTNALDPNFDWDGGTSIPDSRVDIAETDKYYQITVTPNANGDLEPCFHKAVKVSFLIDINAIPQLTIEKKVRIGSTSFVDENSAKAGDKMQYFVELKNSSQAAEHNVVLRDALPKDIKLIPGSVQIRSAANPTLRPAEDNFVNGGFTFATFEPGAWVQVYFNATVGETGQCSWWEKNFAFVKSMETKGVEYFDSVKTTITKECVTTPTPTPTPPTKEVGNLVIVKFNDVNGDGALNNNEKNLANVTFTITGPGGFSQTHSTNADGKISLNNLQPGTYVVTEQVPAGWKATTASSQNVTVVNNSTATAVFGDQKTMTPTPTPTTPSTPKSPPGPPTESGNLPKTGAPTLALLATMALAGSGYLYRRESQKLAEVDSQSKIVS